MKKNMKHYSGKALTKTSVIFSLSALLCIPACGYAENAEAKEMAVQVVQQSRTVKGTITDETGEPMIGVTVRVKGSRAAAVTDLDGKFSLSANQGDFIEVSYVGYETTTVKVTSNTLNLQLKPVASDLDEVVVIGFGTVKKRDLTGSVASIKADAIVQTPTSDVATALQGRISGLDINGDDMRIRGNRSINGSNDPLVIIDGVQGGSMSDLNPNDIESIDVLKDASSTAIYGSQGANGVIIITTKKAEAGKMQVSYDGYVTAAFRPDRAEYRSPENYYETLKLAAQNAGLWNSTNDDASLFSDLESYAAFRAGVWTDYEKLLQKDVTWSNKHTVTLSGGTEKTQARFSLGYANDGNKWKRSSGTDKYTLRANIDHKLYSWINAGVNFQLTHSRNASSPYEKATTTSLELGSPYGVYDAETDTYNIGNTLVERPLASDGYVNPLIDGAGDDLYKNESYFTNIVANAYVDIHPIEGLTFRSQLNTHITNSSEGTYTDGKSAANLDKTGQKSTAEMTKASGTYIEWNNILTYNTTQKNDIHKPKSSLFLKITASIAIVLSVGLGTLYYMEVTRPVGFNTVIVPNSQTANLVLEDGTHIWLNSGSRFTYPTKFARGYRTVKLAGEALFQVNRDEHKPFLVETERLKVRVLGTTFNVKSYSGEDPTVLLKEGQVEVYTDKNKNIRIKPNQMLTVSLETGLSSIREMDASTAGTWRTGEQVLKAQGKWMAHERAFGW